MELVGAAPPSSDGSTSVDVDETGSVDPTVDSIEVVVSVCVLAVVNPLSKLDVDGDRPRPPWSGRPTVGLAGAGGLDVTGLVVTAGVPLVEPFDIVDTSVVCRVVTLAEGLVVRFVFAVLASELRPESVDVTEVCPGGGVAVTFPVEVTGGDPGGCDVSLTGGVDWIFDGFVDIGLPPLWEGGPPNPPLGAVGPLTGV